MNEPFFNPPHGTLEDWISSESIHFSLDLPITFKSTVDKVIASLGDNVKMLGLGEALHGLEVILIIRNRFF